MDYVDIYKNEAYIRTYTPSISSTTGPKSWPNTGLNPLTPPLYTKKIGRPKKSRRKEANEEVSSSQAKSARKSSRNTTSVESNAGAENVLGRRTRLVMTCTNYDE
ncbi:zinc finger protein [Abeliophyllum distichum]|uniref:Zinc finger protein n=1 Tax=Abeliophyllum distichum TaxID=126358 RepID=A0ABD1RRR7_9LAMI